LREVFPQLNDNPHANRVSCEAQERVGLNLYGGENAPVPSEMLNFTRCFGIRKALRKRNSGFNEKILEQFELYMLILE